MTIWVILQNTEFCSTVWEERIYNCVIGLIYCFDFFNLCEGRSRYRVLAFYSIIATENVVFLITFALRFANVITTNTIIATAIAIIGGMFIGLTSMLLYYGKFHPSRMTSRVQRNVSEHPETANIDTPRSLKMFRRASLVSLHVAEISPKVTFGEAATDKQSLLTNAAQISDCVEDGTANRNYSAQSEPVVRVTTECETSHNRAHKEETSSSPNDKPDDAIADSATLSLLYQDLNDDDDDDAEAHHRRKRRGICLPITHGLDTEEKLLSEDANAFLSLRKRRGIYEHDFISQLDRLFPNISNVDLNLDGTVAPDSCGEVTLDVTRNRSELMTPTQQMNDKIFNIEKTSKDSQQQQQRDETMSCVTSVHDYENVCPLGVARPPWCIRSWKGYTDIETYIHDDSVVRDRRRDTLTSTTGTTYSSEYSDGVFAASLISRGILKQDDYADTLIYDLAESKDVKSPYGGNNDDAFAMRGVDDRNAPLFIAKPVVIDDRGGILALDTILEERDDSMSSSLEEDGQKRNFPRAEPARVNSASTLVSTIDQIRRYAAENSPRHVYRTAGTQWEDLNPKKLTARTRIARMLYDNDLKNTWTDSSSSVGPTSPDNSRFIAKREIDAIRELVKCCTIESIKKTPLIDAILSDSPVLGSRDKFTRQVTFEDRKDDFDANENDLYVEMKPLVSVENSCARSATNETASKTPEMEIPAKKNLQASSKKLPELPDKENLAPILSNKCKRLVNNDGSDNRVCTIERHDKSRSSCNVRFNLKEKRHVFLEQVLSPPKLWNKRISFHPSTKNL